MNILNLFGNVENDNIKKKIKKNNCSFEKSIETIFKSKSNKK